MPGASWYPEQGVERGREGRQPWNARRETVPPPREDLGEAGVMAVGTAAGADTISAPGVAAEVDRSADPAPRGPTPWPVSAFLTPLAALFRGGYPRIRG
jgi:hypothetical protein